MCELGPEICGAMPPAPMLGQDANDHGCDSIGFRRWPQGGIADELAECVCQGQAIPRSPLGDFRG